MGFQDPVAAKVAELMFARFRMLPDSEGISDLELAATEQELGARLPRSYCIFLRYFGTQANVLRIVFGLPRDRSWGDIVAINVLDDRPRSRRYIKFAEEGGRAFYFDTAHMDGRGECPVVVRDGCRFVVAADSFADFLSRRPAAGHSARTVPQVERLP